MNRAFLVDLSIIDIVILWWANAVPWAYTGLIDNHLQLPTTVVWHYLELDHANSADITRDIKCQSYSFIECPLWYI